MCVCARARSLTRFFSLCRSNTLQNCSAALRIFSFYERKDSEKHGTFWPDQKRKTPNPLLHLRRKESMSDDEFAELKKKKKKSKKVDFDAFEEDGASAGKDGVAAATEKIEDLDRTFFVWGRKSPLLSLSLSLFLFQRARVFVVNSDRGSVGRSRCERRGVSRRLYLARSLAFDSRACTRRCTRTHAHFYLSTNPFTNATVEEFGKKKKSKKKKKLALSDDEEGGENEDGGGATTSSGGGVQSGLGLPWDGSDRDYHYDELLGRVFGILKEKNPALSEKTKTIIKPPQIAREGTKKTVFANLMEICNAMHRPHEHVTQYMMAELGTTGTLDGQQRLIIKGRFLPKVFEGVLRHYFIDYVICNMCKSSDTQLVEEATTRLSYCRCQSCGASRSVSNIQKGYTAVGRGERRKARAMGT